MSESSVINLHSVKPWIVEISGTSTYYDYIEDFKMCSVNGLLVYFYWKLMKGNNKVVVVILVGMKYI